MFRVAEFEKKRSGQFFKGFGYVGYYLTIGGELRHKRKKIKNDKRFKNYVELNWKTGRDDIYGKSIFQKDIVYDYENHTNGRVEWSKDVGGFVLVAVNGKIEIPYSILDGLSKLELRGNVYQGIVRNRLRE